MKKADKPLSELRRLMDVYPQRLVNIEVKSKPPLDTLPELTGVIRHVEKELGEQGRVFVRYSGTQPMCRVMVEAPTQEACDECCRKIAAVVKEKLGVDHRDTVAC
jgi:phosphoglucosamine mutase